MKKVIFFSLLFYATCDENFKQNEECKLRHLTLPLAPPRLKFNEQYLVREIGNKMNKKGHNFSEISREILSEHPDILGVILTREQKQILALSVSSRLKIFPNRTAETEVFWRLSNTTTNGWGVPFKDCVFLKNLWFYFYNYRSEEYSVTLFLNIYLDQCDDNLKEIFNGTHRCDENQICINEDMQSENRGKYRCICRQGFFYPGANLSWTGLSGEDIEGNRIDLIRCHPCPSECADCGTNGICVVRRDVYLKTIVLCIQLACMGITIIFALIVFKQRKTKAIASGMWTILETILVGIFILYNTVVVKIFEPSVTRCLIEPWTREVGFVICYGAIILKLYRHLTEFRTRKAHRWVVKDTDILKYLLIMIMSVVTYMAAYSSILLNFMKENFSLMYVGRTLDGEQFQACKYLWWDYVTETGELVILIFGIHLAYASRNARTQFHISYIFQRSLMLVNHFGIMCIYSLLVLSYWKLYKTQYYRIRYTSGERCNIDFSFATEVNKHYKERKFLCAAISLELAVSTLFYAARILILHELHPDIVLIVSCVRIQLSQTLALILIFIPKFWYQQKQVRSLRQDYSCRMPLDAFKQDVNAHRVLTGNNSDVEIGEITIADMSPDDIRAELKRLYLQLEMFKAKTICRDNPHISKRRGGRKAQHRRFSLQKKGSREKSLHFKHKEKEKKKEVDTELTEADPTRTPEDSICSEGTSAVYADLPSTTITNSDIM